MVGQKFRIFTTSRFYVHISKKLLKIEAYKQHKEKALSLPYPTGPSLMGFYRASQKVSDVIPVCGLRLEQLSCLPFLFSSALSSAVAYVVHRTAHILA